MANITSNGTGGGNSNDGSTWTGGSVPTSSDNAIIQDGDTVTQNAAHTFKSLKVESGGAWTANGTNHLTLSGENDSDFALSIDGTFTHANGTVVINNGGGGIAHAAILAGDATSTTGLYDLTISGGGTTCEIYNSTTIHRNMEAGGSTTVLRGALTVNGGLTVSATLTTIFSSTSHNLTVKGNTVVSGTLTGNDSTLIFGTDGVHGSTEPGALHVESSGSLTFGSGDLTAFSGFTAKGTNTVTSTGGGDILIKGRTNNGFMNSHSHQGVNITGDYIIDYDNTALFDNRGGTTITCGNFIIKHDGRTYQPWNNSEQGLFQIIGNMDIQNGTFDTQYVGQDSQHLTVTGATSIGPGSGGADQATLNCNASTVSLGSGTTSSFALVINQGGTFDGGSGNHTIGSIDVKNNSNAKMDFTSGNTTLDSERTSDNRNIITNVNSTVTHSNGTIIMTFAGNTEISWESTTSGNEGPYNFTVNNASAIQRSRRSPFRVLGDLKILAGEYNTLSGDSGGDLDLTVTGELKLNGGTLTCNTSDVIVRNICGLSGTLSAPSNSSTNGLEVTGKGTSGDNNNYSMYFTGTTLTNNDGLIVLSADENTFIRMPQALGNFKIRNDGSSTTRVHEFTTNFECDHNLTLENGTLQSYGATQTLTVGDDVLLTKGTLGRASNTSAYEFGSLTIAADGIYLATSGTTTITAENLNAGVGSGAGFAWDNLGTFTHNNGKVVIDTAGNNHTLVKETTFYDLEVNQTSSTYEAKFRPKTGTHSEILNNFTLTSGIYEMHADGDTLDIYGLTTIEADGQFLKDAEHTGLVTHHGLVTNRGNYKIKDGVTVKMNGGIRQLGTFTTP